MFDSRLVPHKSYERKWNQGTRTIRRNTNAPLTQPKHKGRYPQYFGQKRCLFVFQMVILALTLSQSLSLSQSLVVHLTMDSTTTDPNSDRDFPVFCHYLAMSKELQLFVNIEKIAKHHLHVSMAGTRRHLVTTRLDRLHPGGTSKHTVHCGVQFLLVAQFKIQTKKSTS